MTKRGKRELGACLFFLAAGLTCTAVLLGWVPHDSLKNLYCGSLELGGCWTLGLVFGFILGKVSR